MRIKRKMLKATCLVMAVVEVEEKGEVEAEATTDTTDIAERRGTKKTVGMMMRIATLHAQS